MGGVGRKKPTEAEFDETLLVCRTEGFIEAWEKSDTYFKWKYSVQEKNNQVLCCDYNESGQKFATGFFFF